MFVLLIVFHLTTACWGRLALRRLEHAFIIEDPDSVTFSSENVVHHGNHYVLEDTRFIPRYVEIFNGEFNVTRPVGQVDLRHENILIQLGGARVTKGDGIYLPMTGFYFVFFPKNSRPYLDNVLMETWQEGHDVIFACAGQALIVVRPRTFDFDDTLIGAIYLRSLNRSTDFYSLCPRRQLEIQNDTVFRAVKECNFVYKYAVTNDQHWSSLGYPKYGNGNGVVLQLLLNFFPSQLFSNASFAAQARRGLFKVDWCRREILNVSTAYVCNDRDWILETVCEVLSEHTSDYLHQLSTLSDDNWLPNLSTYIRKDAQNVTQIFEKNRGVKELLGWLTYFQYDIAYAQFKTYDLKKALTEKE